MRTFPRAILDMNVTRSSAPGWFRAVGVGPGDPQLVTLKAIETIRQADVLYHAGPSAEHGRALDVVRRFLRPEQQIRIVLTVPMAVASAGDVDEHYRPGVEQIAEECRRGRNVVFITEGDPTLYSTAACVWQLLRKLAREISIAVIPGVPSFTAAAARAAWPLAQRDSVLTIVPAVHHRERLDEWVNGAGTVCFLKPAAALPDVSRLVMENQRQALYAEEVGTPREFVTEDLNAADGRSNYFSLVVVRPAAEARTSLARAGAITVVGLGPGATEVMTAQARKAVRRADVVIGYEGYLRPLGALGLTAEMRPSAIGTETERATEALELAAAGRRVALVSSGDAGVYGMASLLLETARDFPDLDIEVVPGVTAATAAAALLGAPLGHDFACISLSDLLTPWDVIERRLEAAGQGDFVIALYNPLSRRRNWQLARSRDILLRYRRSDAPVGIVDRAYRPGQSVRTTTLEELTSDGITMETVLLVGNSQTKTIGGRMITPRGYNQPARANTPTHMAPTPLGRDILYESFALIERELGPRPLPRWAYVVLRRMIHASADFAYAELLRFSEGFDEAVQAAFRARAPIVTDTEMVRHGIRTALERTPDVPLVCHLNDPEVAGLAEESGLTRSAAGIRVAARRYLAPVLVIGNAPTALDELLRLSEEENWRPAAVIAIPVGFVGVVEAKERLLAQTRLPYLTAVGRKGGSAVTAAAVNALVECFLA